MPLIEALMLPLLICSNRYNTAEQTALTYQKCHQLKHMQTLMQILAFVTM